MRYTLIDRITQLEPGIRIVGTKCVSLAEEYLADHFPKFPVLPGVFMLEAATQTSAWLIRASEDFAHSVVVLKEARNIKYANFLSPGQVLTITAEITKHDARETKLTIEGNVDGETNVSGRLVLERYNLAETRPEWTGTDLYMRRELRKLFRLLYREDSAALNGHPRAS